MVRVPILLLSLMQEESIMINYTREFTVLKLTLNKQRWLTIDR
jgi:hypothetical protein